MKERIIKELKEIEKENDIKILYSCEAGSRSWGFDHPNSDYDVRFIYKRNKLSDYLRLEDKKDTIDKAIEGVDFFGWDIKKALDLHLKSNPELREWLVMKDIYIPLDSKYFGGLPEFDTSVLKRHYTNIVNIDLHKKHRGKDERKLKRRLYDIRCILTWKVLDKGLEPKIKVVDLMDQIDLDYETKKNIIQIINDHRNQNEKIKKDNLAFIDKWIDESFNLMVQENKKLINKDKDKEIYDKRFYDIVTENI